VRWFLCTTRIGQKAPSSKGQLTRGQRAEKIRVHATDSIHKGSSCDDIPENDVYDNDREMENLEKAQTQLQVLKSSTQQLCGIKWLTSDTNFDSFPLVSFSEEQISCNYATVSKIFDDINMKFASKYVGIFSDDVMTNWKAWLQNEQQRWNPWSKRTTHATLHIPCPFSSRCPSIDEELPDLVYSAPADIEDGIEYVSHRSGVHGALTKRQQREALGSRAFHTLSFNDSEHSCEGILENMACIYKYEYPHLQSGTIVEQIGVGIILKVSNPEEPNAVCSIRFCPPKGAKPQTSKRPDSLYQDIQAAMQFNMKYNIKKKTKTGVQIRPDIEQNQTRDCLLAFNLDITKEGRFSSLPRVGDHGGAFSSLQFAHQVIDNYYNEKRLQRIAGTS
jgi:hypothetical protein